jgi:hypothetical protein
MNENELLELYSNFSVPSLPFQFIVAVIIVILPLATITGFHAGQIEHRRRDYSKVEPEKIPGGTSLGAMLALLGLLLGFAFSSALGWREARQSALVNEAMAISTAFLTADLLDDPGRTDLQQSILSYAQTRLATRQDISSEAALDAFLSRTLSAQSRVWPTTLQAIEGATSDPVRTTVARSVTDMLDAHTLRLAAAAEKLPSTARLMILVVATASVLIVGNRSALQGRKLTWRTFVFAGVLAVIMIIITDLDRALEGTIQMNPDTLLATIHEMETALAGRSN